MTNDTSLESSCAIFLESANSIAKSSYILKTLAKKKICPKNKNYTLLKSP